MNILSIDVGTYSIKFIESQYERKSLVHLNTHQIVIEDYAQGFPKEITQEEIQQEIIKEYIKKGKFEGRIIYQYPNKYLTTRFLTLPVISRKKAEMMIPFQLDKNLLFSSNDIHFANQLMPNKNSIYSLTSVSELSQFDNYYKKLENNHILPESLTSEISIIQSYAQNRRLDDACCLLDIGHETSKAYMISNRKIISFHVSYVAGKVFDELIAETYKISQKEAIQYKIKSSFFLTEKQIEGVDKDQQEFAKLMRQGMAPLLADLRKWELGMRVNFGHRISQIYLLGGTSNIRNICNFFTLSLAIKTQHLEAFGQIHQQNIQLGPQERTSYSMAHLMALSMTQKLPATNFLTGNYASTYHEEIPLHSATFIGLRVLMVTAILLLCLFVERHFINKGHLSYDLKITKLIKMPEMEISKRDQRKYKVKPSLILNSVNKKFKSMEQEVHFVESAVKVDALSPWLALSTQLRQSPNWDMTKMENVQGLVTAQFLGHTDEALNELKDQLKTLPYKDVKVMEDDKAKTLTLEFRKN